MRGSYDEVRVRIYPSGNDIESVLCRHRAWIIAALSAAAVAFAALCVATSIFIWTGHIRRRTPVATNVINHYAVSHGLHFKYHFPFLEVWAIDVSFTDDKRVWRLRS